MSRFNGARRAMAEIARELRLVAKLASHTFRGTLGWGAFGVLLVLVLLIGVQFMGAGGVIRAAMANGDPDAAYRLLAGPVRETCDLGALVGLFAVLAAGSRALSVETKQRTLLLVLSRPVSRAQVLWGLALGVTLIGVLIVIAVAALGATVFCLFGAAPGPLFLFGALYYSGMVMLWGFGAVALSAHAPALGAFLGSLVYFMVSGPLTHHVQNDSPIFGTLLGILTPANLPREFRSILFSSNSLVDSDYNLVLAIVAENVLLGAALLTLSAMVAERRDLRLRE
jgi:hypothetical protein